MSTALLPPPSDLPDLNNYVSYRDWLARVLKVVERTRPPGSLGSLAKQARCAQSHLRNIAAKRRHLASPLLERLAEALNLPEAQARLLALKVALERARSGAKRAAAQRAMEAFELAQGLQRPTPTPGEDGPVVGTVLRALSGTPLWQDAAGLADVLWPPVSVSDVKRLCVLSQGGGAGAFGPTRRGLASPGPAEIAWTQDVLRCARLALSTLPLGRRLLRFSIWLVPETGWPEELAALAARFQTETAAWAERLRASKGPFLAMGVYLQDTPLSASLSGSGQAWVEGALRAENASSIERTQGAPPPGMVDPSQILDHPVSFAFDDFRKFVLAKVAARRARRRPDLPAYTLNQLARQIGCPPGTLGNALSGRRGTPDKYLGPLIDALNLPAAEAEDAHLLAQYTDCTSIVERGHILRARMASPAFQAARPVGAAAMKCLSELVHISVAELARHPQFRPDPDWIASVLTVPCTADQARAALADLQRVGVLAPDGSGDLRPTGESGSLDSMRNPDLHHALHRANLAHARHTLAREPARTRQAGQVILLPVTEVDALLERVRAFHTELDALSAELQRAPPAEVWSVRLLTLQLFQGSEPIHPRL